MYNQVKHRRTDESLTIEINNFPKWLHSSGWFRFLWLHLFASLRIFQLQSHMLYTDISINCMCCASPQPKHVTITLKVHLETGDYSVGACVSIRY